MDLPEKTTINIRVPNGRATVSARVFGTMAVHQTLLCSGLFDADDWTVTHLPSGFGMGFYFRNLEFAVKAAKAFDAIMDWRTFDPRGGIDLGLKLRVCSIASHYHGRQERGAEESAASVCEEFSADWNGFGSKSTMQ